MVCGLLLAEEYKGIWVLTGRGMQGFMGSCWHIDAGVYEFLLAEEYRGLWVQAGTGMQGFMGSYWQRNAEVYEFMLALGCRGLWVLICKKILR